MIQAIAFDFDGVLVETLEVKTRAYRKLFESESTENLERILSYHLQNGGVSRFEKFRTIYRDILERPLGESQFQHLCQAFAQLVVEEVVAAPWVLGAREFLSRHRFNHHFFIVSGTPQEELVEIVHRRGMATFFDEILGSPRTKIELLREVLQRYRLAPTRMLFIGDSRTDWEAARENGILFVWRQAPEGLSDIPDTQSPRLSDLKGLDRVLVTLNEGI